MQIAMTSLEILRRFWQKFGPYIVVEIMLPGGSLLALLLFLYRRRKLNGGMWVPGELVPMSISRPTERL